MVGVIAKTSVTVRKNFEKCTGYQLFCIRVNRIKEFLLLNHCENSFRKVKPNMKFIEYMNLVICSFKVDKLATKM